jgi:TorA maturation chaperone TorD
MIDATLLESTGAAGIDLAARQTVALALAAALRQPSADARLPAVPPPVEILSAAWEVATAPFAAVPLSELGLGERPPRDADCAPLLSWLSRPAGERRSAWQAVFGLVISRECPPYETEYCQSRDAMHRAQHMADLAGFYAAFGVQPDASQPERVDHISLHLAFVALLQEGLVELAQHADAETPEREQVRREALVSFIRDHVAWWFPAFARALEVRAQRVQAGSPACSAAIHDLAGIARLLAAWVAIERLSAGIEPPRRIITPDVHIPDHADHDCAGGAPAGTARSCFGCGGTE